MGSPTWNEWGYSCRLVDVKGPVDQPKWGGRAAYLRDPDGNLIELFQQIPMADA